MKFGVSRALRAVFGAKRSARYMVLVAVLLALPSVFGGLAADDYIHLAMYLGYLPKPADASLFGLFSFLTGNPSENEQLADIGYLPWWSAPGLRVTFFRPLSELSHALDYKLWADSPALMHLHSVVWFAVLVYLVSRLYASIAGTGQLRNVATYVYAVSALHATTVGWIANRNGLIAGSLGVACLIFYDLWRRKQKAFLLALSSMALAAALFSAEAAIACFAYLVAYALFIDSGSIQQRVLSLAPFCVVLVAWRLCYNALGFGAYASGLYLDPSTEPLEFLRGFTERAPILLMAQLTGLPTSLYIFMKQPQQHALWLMAVALVAGTFALFLSDLWRQKESRFFLVGMLFALLPVGAAGTDERSLIFVSLGGAGLVATLVSRYFLSDTNAPQGLSAIRKRCAYGLVATHIVLAPVVFLANVNGLSTFTHPFTDQALKLPVDDGVQDEDLMLINSPAPQLNMHLAAIRLLHGLPLPRSSSSLAPGNTQLKVTRQQNSLVIEAEDGFVINYDTLFRGQGHPFKVGDAVRLKSLTAVVKRITGDGRPETVEFTFTDGLDNLRLKFLAWENNGYRHFALPVDGETIELGRQDPIKIVLASMEGT
jgi:hypothetical protein